MVDLIGSGAFGCANSWHPCHDLQYVSTSLSMPGHHTLLLNACLVPTIPWCPSCASASACGRSLRGGEGRGGGEGWGGEGMGAEGRGGEEVRGREGREWEGREEGKEQCICCVTSLIGMFNSNPMIP